MKSAMTPGGLPAARRYLCAVRNLLLRVSAAAILFLLPLSCARTNVENYAAAMERFCREHGFNGSILIAERGKIIFSGAYGFADFRAGVPNTTETVFKIASISKQFTAACVLLLRERKLLDLDDPVSKFLTDYPRGDEIRIVHLLSHTSGVVEYANVAFLGRANRSFTPEELVRHFKDKPLRFAPGTKFEYSNSNYVLLGAIIERVSGMAYGDFLAAHIFGPLGMRNSRYGNAPNQAVGYLRPIRPGDSADTAAAGTAAFPLDPSASYASGGIVSTVEDLFIWDRALEGTEILSRKSIALMLVSPFEFSEYGLGWRIERAGNRPTVQHFGSVSGGASYIYRDTRRARTIIILSNIQSADLASIRKQALEEWENAE